MDNENKYEPEEIENLLILLLSHQEDNHLIAIEIMKDRGLPQALERPIALIVTLNTLISEKVFQQLNALFSRLVDAKRRNVYKQELRILNLCFEFPFPDYNEEDLLNSIHSLFEHYAVYLKRNKKKYYEILLELIIQLEDDNLLIASEVLTKELINIYPKDTFLISELARFYSNYEQYEKAIPYYLLGLELEPENIEIRKGLATSYREGNQARKAVDQLKLVLEMSPDNLDALYLLIEIKWHDLNQKTEARQLLAPIISYYERSYQNNPKEYILLAALAKIKWYYFDDLEAATQLYHKLDQINYLSSYVCLEYAQMHLERSNDFEKAEQILNKALAPGWQNKESWQAKAFKMLGDIHFQKSPPDYIQAKQAYEETLLRYLNSDDRAAVEVALNKLDELI